MFFFKKKPKAEITLFNTEDRKKEIFEPIRVGVMKMYSCGPTVYDYVHIGNLRSFVLSDIVRRIFEYSDYKVTQVMNITDFGHLVGDADDTEDKMILALKREGKELTMENMLSLATTYVEAFKEDMSAMNIRKPHVMPRASEHIGGQIAYVETLMHKGFAYKTSDGIYFDTGKFPEYGKLGGVSSEKHSRIEQNGEKKDSKDFALWKFSPDMGWDAPWGKGFPGWHTECVAMSTQYLGKTFDVHTGGIDHIAIHHNNEIAQAEAVNDRPYANYWLHNEFITIDSTRIGKSEGNAITLKQLVNKNVSPLAYRYWLLTGHYRQSMNFTWEAVSAAQTAYQRALRAFNDLKVKKGGSVDSNYKNKFEEAIYDDLNTPEAIAVMWELLKDNSVSDSSKRATILTFDKVLGLGFGKVNESQKVSVMSEKEIPEEAKELLKEREMARGEKDFGKADLIRDQLKELGFDVVDTEEGSVLNKI